MKCDRNVSENPLKILFFLYLFFKAASRLEWRIKVDESRPQRKTFGFLFTINTKTKYSLELVQIPFATRKMLVFNSKSDNLMPHTSPCVSNRKTCMHIMIVNRGVK